MPSQRLHPVCRALRTAREVMDSTVLFLVFLALAVILISHLYRFVASAIHADAKNIPAVSSKTNEERLMPAFIRLTKTRPSLQGPSPSREN